MDRTFVLGTLILSGIVFLGVLFAPPEKHRRADPTQGVMQPVSNVYYTRCRDAWDAGVAPIYEGQPGYREGLDGDGDGIACEPYRGRRY